ncbi:MAG: DUF5683 domain-containing protein [bacterium]
MRRCILTCLCATALTLSVPSRVRSAEQEGKSPFWAMAASAAIPGGGQFYCENYLRGAIFCAAQATLAAMSLYEHMLTEEAHRRYKQSGSLEDYGDYAHHFDRRNDLLWWDVGVWVFSIADAFVDAHMYRFGSRKGLRLGVLEKGGVGVHLSFAF